MERSREIDPCSQIYTGIECPGSVAGDFRGSKANDLEKVYRSNVITNITQYPVRDDKLEKS